MSGKHYAPNIMVVYMVGMFAVMLLSLGLYLVAPTAPGILLSYTALGMWMGGCLLWYMWREHLYHKDQLKARAKQQVINRRFANRATKLLTGGTSPSSSEDRAGPF